MELKTILYISIACYIVVLIGVATSAPSSVSIASTGDTGAVAGAGNGGAFAYSDPGSNSKKPSGGSGISVINGGSSSNPSRMQSVIVGQNGDTTVLQQNGNGPTKVYKIPASGSG